MPAFRHPVVAVSHGPGALWLLSSEIFGMSKKCRSAKALQSLFEKLCPDGKNLPKRILVVSAHFEAVSEGFEISKAAKPDIIFDYYGLPAEAYDVDCPAEGDPEFSRKLEAALARNNIKAKLCGPRLRPWCLRANAIDPTTVRHPHRLHVDQLAAGQ